MPPRSVLCSAVDKSVTERSRKAKIPLQPPRAARNLWGLLHLSQCMVNYVRQKWLSHTMACLPKTPKCPSHHRWVLVHLRQWWHRPKTPLLDWRGGSPTPVVFSNTQGAIRAASFESTSIINLNSLIHSHTWKRRRKKRSIWSWVCLCGIHEARVKSPGGTIDHKN